MDLRVLAQELLELREDFQIPDSHPSLLISAETCIIAAREIKTADPEIRLLANFAYRSNETIRLIEKLLGNDNYLSETMMIDNRLLIFTFPASFPLTAAFKKIVGRTIEQLKLRQLASIRLEQLELRITQLTRQIDFEQEKARVETTQIVRKWMLENSNVNVDSEVIDLLKGQTTVEIYSRLTASLQLEQFLHPGRNSFEITSENLQTITPTPLAQPSSAGEKANLLLDRYEVAARKVLEMNLKLNGKNIALLCEPAVSPPAITDALQKHRKQMERLLAEHPEKWINARKGLKPLREIDEKLKYNAA